MGKVYHLSARGVVLYIDPKECGGSFWSVNDDGLTEIVVGKSQDYYRALAILVHEATECVMCHLGLRFAPAPDFAYDNAGYVFMMTHAQFSEVCARVGEFLAECISDFSKTYKRL